MATSDNTTTPSKNTTHTNDSTAPTKPVATIVVPVFNEEALLQTAVNDLIVRLAEELPELAYEIIITENGSTDKTLEHAYELERKHPQVKVLHSPEPNYGKALRRGILEAKGTYVLCDEIDICDVGFQKRALELLRADQCDMVVGSKAHQEAQDQRPVFRRAGTAVMNGLLRILLDFKGTDTHGLKAFHRDRLLPIVSRCIEDKDLFASEFVIRAERDAFRIVEVPIVIHEKRPPSINLMKRVPRVLRGLAKLTWAIRIQGR